MKNRHLLAQGYLARLQGLARAGPGRKKTAVAAGDGAQAAAHGTD
jgi:hypothetical protein